MKSILNEGEVRNRLSYEIKVKVFNKFYGEAEVYVTINPITGFRDYVFNGYEIFKESSLDTMISYLKEHNYSLIQ